MTQTQPRTEAPKSASSQPQETDQNLGRSTKNRATQASVFGAALSFKNISAIYIFVGIFILFSILTPETFLTIGVWRTLLDAQAITVLAAIAVLIPLITGAFNLAIGAEVGLAGILVALFLAKLDLPIAIAVPATLLAGGLVGLVSGLIITRAKIDSFIATLGMSSILAAAIAWFSGSRQILGLPEEFRRLATSNIARITTPVIVMLVIAALVWYITERTAIGRRMYAAGLNPTAAGLAGVNTGRLQLGALVAGGMIASIAGVLLASRINTGDPTVGPSLLLPALTAVFLGSTQFRGGRFNVWGTVIAVYVLAVGVKGLQLVGAPLWINELFNGVALLLAVGLSRWEGSHRTGAIRRALPWLRKRPGTPETAPTATHS